MSLHKIQSILAEGAERCYPKEERDIMPLKFCPFFYCESSHRDGSLECLEDASDDVKNLLCGVEFERNAATLEMQGRDMVARSLRQHGSELCAEIERVKSLVSNFCDEAKQNANALCCQFLGVSHPERFHRVLSWIEIKLGVTTFVDIGGDLERRERLSNEIKLGPPNVWTICRDQGNLDDERRVAELYWSALNDASHGIARVRYQLRSAIESMLAFVDVLIEGNGEGSASKTDGKKSAESDCEVFVEATFTPNQHRVLQAMNRYPATQLLNASMIAKETADLKARPPLAPLSERTVLDCLTKLIAAGLAERPAGARSGATLNRKGRIQAKDTCG